MEGEEDEELKFNGESSKALSSSSSSADKPQSSSSAAHDEAETNILSTLFASSGVHSALKHDEIMDSAKQEHLIVEREGKYFFRVERYLLLCLYFTQKTPLTCQ